MASSTLSQIHRYHHRSGFHEHPKVAAYAQRFMVELLATDSIFQDMHSLGTWLPILAWRKRRLKVWETANTSLRDFRQLLALGTTSPAPAIQSTANNGRLLGEEFPDDALATAPQQPAINHPDDATEVSIPSATARSTSLIINSRPSALHGQCQRWHRKMFASNSSFQTRSYRSRGDE